MNFHKLENKNLIVCYSKKELTSLYKDDQLEKIMSLAQDEASSITSLEKIFEEKKEDITDRVAQDSTRSRDIHEIFASLYVYLDFFKEGSEVCFELQNTFNPNKNSITTLKELNKFRSGQTDTDFIIKTHDGFRAFQLKRYREKLNTQDVFSFIKKKVEHYGSNLGDTNLLVILQSLQERFMEVDFADLHKRLKGMNLKFDGQILISYNENGQFLVINQVYPKLTTSSIPVVYPSAKC